MCIDVFCEKGISKAESVYSDLLITSKSNPTNFKSEISKFLINTYISTNIFEIIVALSKLTSL